MSQSPALFEDGELAAAPDSLAQGAFDAWNEAAKKHGWPAATALAAGRPAKLRRTLKDVGGLHAWRALLEKCGTSEFLCGKSRSGDRKPFILTLDWIVKPANLLKCMEGNYWRATVPTMSIIRQAEPQDHWAKFLRDYRPRGFWPSSLGPRPEDAACRAPPAMLEACRKRLGIVVVAPVRETREERLAAMVVTYRNSGHWDRANAIEQELAALTGRPAVLVPAPEVAQLGMPPKPAVAPRQAVVSDVTDDYDMVPEGEPYEDGI